MSKLSRNTFVEIPVIAAIAFILGLIPIQTGNAAIDLSLGLIPLFVLAIRRGFLPAVLAGLIWSLLNIIFGHAYIVSVVQGFIEYPVAFSFAGFSGLYSNKVKQSIKSDKTGSIFSWLSLSIVVGVFARWFWHFIAGIVFWGSYAPKGMPVVLYSLSTNGVSFIANVVMLFIVLSIIAKTNPSVFLPKENGFRRN
jgi:thiamine transporter